MNFNTHIDSCGHYHHLHLKELLYLNLDSHTLLHLSPLTISHLFSKAIAGVYSFEIGFFHATQHL